MTKSNFVISVRDIVKKGGIKRFGDKPGPIRYLEVPDKKVPNPNHKKDQKKWLDLLWKRAKGNGILIFVHGYNNIPPFVMKRHDLLQKGLSKYGFKGAIVSYDWPSGTSWRGYLKDIQKAKRTARHLVCDGIMHLVKRQKNDTSDAEAI